MTCEVSMGSTGLRQQPFLIQPKLYNRTRNISPPKTQETKINGNKLERGNSERNPPSFDKPEPTLGMK